MEVKRGGYHGKKYLWLVVDNDKYELPVFVGDSSKEVADWLGWTYKYADKDVRDACKNNETVKHLYKIKKVEDYEED